MTALAVTTGCEWFALCENDAEGVVAHPALGLVPACARCAQKAEAELLVPAELIRRSSDERRANMDRATRTQAEVVEECFVCGRGLTEKGLARSSWIEHTTSGYLVAVAAESPADSQGCFPVGSECSKSVPAAFRLKAIR